MTELRPSYLAEIEKVFARFMCDLLPAAALVELETAGKDKDVRFIISILTRKNFDYENKNEKHLALRLVNIIDLDLETYNQTYKLRRRLQNIRRDLNRLAHNHDKKSDPIFQKAIAAKIEAVIRNTIAPDKAEEYLTRLHEICDLIGIEHDRHDLFVDIRGKLYDMDAAIRDIKNRHSG